MRRIDIINAVLRALHGAKRPLSGREIARRCGWRATVAFRELLGEFWLEGWIGSAATGFVPGWRLGRPEPLGL